MQAGQLQPRARGEWPRRFRFSSSVIEDYGVLLVEQLAGPCATDALAAHPVVQAALLGERRILSASATGLTTSMSYYPDDLALLSWNAALLIDPDPRCARSRTARSGRLERSSDPEGPLLLWYDRGSYRAMHA